MSIRQGGNVGSFRDRRRAVTDGAAQWRVPPRRENAAYGGRDVRRRQARAVSLAGVGANVRREKWGKGEKA